MARNLNEIWNKVKAVDPSYESEPLAITAVCQQQIVLVAAYDSTTSDYRLAVERLHSRLGVVPSETYEAMRRDAEAARVRSEDVRVALERHFAEHGC